MERWLLLLFFIACNNVNGQTIVTWLDDNPNPSSGQYFFVTGNFTFDMSTAGDLWFDISFPNGVDKVEIANSNSWGADTRVYNPGDTIYHKTSGQMIAKYHLVSAHLKGYTGTEDLHLKIKVFPNISGEVEMYFRGTYKFNSTTVTAPAEGKGWTTDQQGWDVYMTPHLHNPKPDIGFSSIIVNNGDTIYEGMNVQIKAKIADNNGFGCAQAKVKFFIQGVLAGASFTTGSVPSSGTTSASLDYSFTTAGDYIINAEVDPDNTIDESNEANNSINKIITVNKPATSVIDKIFSPKLFNLNQNFPNPFNPATTITFSVPHKSNVTIELYSLLGQKIEMITNREYEAGEYSQKLDASYLPAGIYLVKMNTREFQKSIKINLVK